jgi:hypothetical protein
MAKFVAVNGIKTTGEDSIDRLTCELVKRGHEVVDLGLPVIGVIGASRRSIQMRNGRLLRDAVVSNFGEAARVNVITHSNGAPTLFRSMWFAGVRYDNLFVFNASFRSDWAWPAEGFRRMYNIYNPYDKALKWGERSRWLMPNHIFGSLGRTGYDGPPDRRIICQSNAFRDGKNWHNPWHRWDLAEFWAEWIDERVDS